MTTFWANTINIIKTFKNTVVKEKFCNMYISQSAANNIFIIIEHNACHIQQRVNYFYTLVRVIEGSISFDVIGQFSSSLNLIGFICKSAQSKHLIIEKKHELLCTM